MYITQTTFGSTAQAGSAEDSICPYRKAQSQYCSASIMTMRIDQRKKMTYCLTEDFDCCPVFLAKVLRGTGNNFSQQ